MRDLARNRANPKRARLANVTLPYIANHMKAVDIFNSGRRVSGSGTPRRLLSRYPCLALALALRRPAEYELLQSTDLRRGIDIPNIYE